MLMQFLFLIGNLENFFNIILPPHLSLQDLENAHKKATMSSKDSESVLLIDKML